MKDFEKRKSEKLFEQKDWSQATKNEWILSGLIQALQNDSTLHTHRASGWCCQNNEEVWLSGGREWGALDGIYMKQDYFCRDRFENSKVAQTRAVRDHAMPESGCESYFVLLWWWRSEVPVPVPVPVASLMWGVEIDECSASDLGKEHSTCGGTRSHNDAEGQN